MEIGPKIKKLREERGMTLEELGDKVGVGKSTVRKWENGIIANMRRDKISKLANALGCSPAELMGWDSNLETSGGFVAQMLMDEEFTSYVKKLYSFPKETRSKVYGYIDALGRDGE